MSEGRVASINVSPGRGTKKKPVQEARLVVEQGIEGDGHLGFGHKQVSLLADESAQKMRDKGLDVGFGDFAENVTTRGVDLASLELGDEVLLGDEVVLVISQIGKECHHGCEIAKQAGQCVMPTEGVFGRVVQGGTVRVGDKVAFRRRPTP